MRARRSGRNHLRDIFFNTGDEHMRTAGESFDVTNMFMDATNQEMLDDERLQRKHRLEREHQNDIIYPSCDLSERPVDTNVPPPVE